LPNYLGRRDIKEKSPRRIEEGKGDERRDKKGLDESWGRLGKKILDITGL